MGTSSYVLVGTQGAMEQTFGSTCHGAGRAMSRAQSKKKLGYKEVCHISVLAGPCFQLLRCQKVHQHSCCTILVDILLYTCMLLGSIITSCQH